MGGEGRGGEKKPIPTLFLPGPQNSLRAIGFADRSPRAAASILMTGRALAHWCMAAHTGGSPVIRFRY